MSVLVALVVGVVGVANAEPRAPHGAEAPRSELEQGVKRTVDVGRPASPGRKAATKKPRAERPLTAEQRAALIRRAERCQANPDAAECFDNLSAINNPAGPGRPSNEQIIQSVIARLKLPAGQVRIGPDPSVNEWNMAVVGYPLWLWVEGPDRVTTTETAYGMTITITAVRNSTTFTMGDGGAVTCTRSTQYTAQVKPGTPSPTCGYTYRRASLPRGRYTVTATSAWTFSWTMPGETGSTPGQTTVSRQVPVGELQAVVVR